MRKLHININGSKIRYTLSGNGQKTILFVHGNSLSSDIFIHQLESSDLQSHFKLIALDLLGYGSSARSNKPELEYSIPHQAQLIVQFCKQLNLSNMIVVGHSLGGNILIEAIKSLKIIDLVLVASPPAENPMNQNMFMPHPAIPLFFKDDLSEEDLETLIAGMLFYKEENISFLKDILKKSDPSTRSMVLKFITNAQYDDQVNFLKTLSIPIKIIVGSNDALVNCNYITNLSLNLYKNEIQFIPKAGHLPFLENPKAFNQLFME